MEPSTVDHGSRRFRTNGQVAKASFSHAHAEFAFLATGSLDHSTCGIVSTREQCGGGTRPCHKIHAAAAVAAATAFYAWNGDSCWLGREHCVICHPWRRGEAAAAGFGVAGIDRDDA